MLSAVLGLFSQDLAVDLGTSETRIYQRGVGLIAREPSVVVVHTDRRGSRRVVAVGREAIPMLGRTPPDLAAIQPIQGGHVVEFEVAEALLSHLIRKVHGRNQWVAPKVVLAVPWGATEMERRALRESCETAGARSVHLVDRPLAAALGAALPVERPSGHLVVDMGAGETAIALISLSGVVAHQTVPGGGRAIDGAIEQILETSHGLLVGPQTAERLKLDLASAGPHLIGRTAVCRGRCAKTGLPRAVEVHAEELHLAVTRSLAATIRGVRSVLDRVPAELAADVADHGVVLTGGGARLRGVERALREATGLPVVGAEHPDDAVVVGLGRVSEELALMETIAC